MKAEITSEGKLLVQPDSLTEESFLNLWYSNKIKNGAALGDVIVPKALSIPRPNLVDQTYTGSATGRYIPPAEAPGPVSEPETPTPEPTPEPEEIIPEALVPPAATKGKGKTKEKTLTERDLIKKELIELKIEFNTKDGTPKLRKMLADATGSDPAPAAPAAGGKGKTKKTELSGSGKGTISAEELRVSLKRYYAKYGAEEAKKLLVKFGAPDVSSVKEADRAPFVKEITDREAQNDS